MIPGVFNLKYQILFEFGQVEAEILPKNKLPSFFVDTVYFTCPFCEKKMGTQNKSKHVQQKSALCCDQCDFKTAQKSNLERHMQVHIEYEYDSKACCLKTKTLLKLEKHKLRVHRTPKDKDKVKMTNVIFVKSNLNLNGT